MPFCPVCLSEFRHGFSRCNTCDVDLVERIEAEMELSEQNVRQALEGKELVAVTRGSLDVVKETRDLLSANRIASIIVDDQETQVPTGHPKRVLLAVSQGDMEATGKVLGESFRQMMIQEGVGRASDLVYENCPACGTPVPEDQVECPDCGLHIDKV